MEGPRRSQVLQRNSQDGPLSGQSLGQDLKRGQPLARDLSGRQQLGQQRGQQLTPSAGQALQRKAQQRQTLANGRGEQLSELSFASPSQGQALSREEPTSEQMSKQAMAMGGQLMMRAAAAQQTKMGGRPGADRALLPTAAVTLDTFLHDFSVGKLINKLADLEQHNLRAQIAAVSRPQAQPSASQAAAKPPTPAALVAELQVVDKLLVNFQRAEKEMGDLEKMVDQKVQALHEKLRGKEEEFQEQLEAMEVGLEKAQSTFSQLDAQMSQSSQTAAKIGDRLHNAEGFRKRALEGVKVVTYLQEFANVAQLSELSELFQDDNRLAEAAAVTRHILTIGQELTFAKERVALLDEAPRSSGPGTPQPGSIEQAVAQVEAFRGLLEHRVIARFDAAVAAGDLGGMAECARIMAEFRQGESQLVQRYISTRPMFIDVRELSAGAAGAQVTDATTAGIAVRDLGQLYKGLLAAVKEEALVMEQVFPSPRTALIIFLQRVFEQRVQAAVDRMLVVHAPNASAEARQQHLKLLVEVYKRTHALAEQLQEVVGDGTDVMEMSEGVFAEALADYPGMELAWLQLLYDKAAQQAEATPTTLSMPSVLLSGFRSKTQSQGVSPELVKQFLDWNAEAATRCEVLSPAGAAPANVRALFHSSTVQRACSGCLLEQVASHLISGLSQAVQACAAANSATYGMQSITAPSRIAITKAAYAVVEGSVGRVLEAVGAATGIIRALQQHYAREIEPRVEPAPVEATACATGLAALVRAVERQADRTLVAEQRRTDFRPPEDGDTPQLDRPTEACALVAALLSALLRLAAQSLQASNLASFDTEARPFATLVGRRAHALLVGHMQRYVYSAMGALRWKRDVTEYADILRNSHSPTTNAQARRKPGLHQHHSPRGKRVVAAQMEDLAALVNILLVSPDSLIGLVQTSLHMSHKQALQYIRLREDFATAKVDGVPLAKIFSHE
ncbi:Sec10-domain-containing protein [Coccomyxa subellipsoidea C-169]|uniref:Sec10-domain-containing protein n=1 Tax=Coccomyxa subellipsoidea (strain C-169) TaxID=574566 RepID=I0Z812_COCSC|nr:Sec10-domain-containing protein [Coccomyxa subellipsoidea C-169]EIE26781.1 Sec10-domain-containing protein [Coccomyxa subellipsoidea C-169]|eukprot:XP_005651325.1 Sec10-domain-containing protein [Coccomyxa subellipsoidea C-169]